MKKVLYYIVMVFVLYIILIIIFLNKNEKTINCFGKIENDENDEIYNENVEIYYNSNGILSQNERNFLNLINNEREKNNVCSLTINDELQNVARLKALDMAENNYLEHESPQYGTLQNMLKSYNIECNYFSENIAKSENLICAVELFNNSEEHKKNILNGNFEYTGVAISKRYDGSKIFVELFIAK